MFLLRPSLRGVSGALGSYQGRCVICGGAGISDAFYCKERLELVRMVLGTFEMVTDSLPATESVWVIKDHKQKLNGSGVVRVGEIVKSQKLFPRHSERL